MSKPPPLPAEVLARVLRLARFDGLALLIVAGGFAVISGAMGDYTGALVGTFAAGAGVGELHGCHLLRARQPRGMGWLVFSQLLLLATLLVYAASCVTAYDTAWIRSKLTPTYLNALEQAGMSPDQFVQLARSVVLLVYATLAGVTVLYQGGMSLYYHRRKGIVTRALSDS